MNRMSRRTFLALTVSSAALASTGNATTPVSPEVVPKSGDPRVVCPDVDVECLMDDHWHKMNAYIRVMPDGTEVFEADAPMVYRPTKITRVRITKNGMIKFQDLRQWMLGAGDTLKFQADVEHPMFLGARA